MFIQNDAQKDVVSLRVKDRKRETHQLQTLKILFICNIYVC